MCSMPESAGSGRDSVWPETIEDLPANAAAEATPAALRRKSLRFTLIACTPTQGYTST